MRMDDAEQAMGDELHIFLVEQRLPEQYEELLELLVFVVKSREKKIIQFCYEEVRESLADCGCGETLQRLFPGVIQEVS